METKSFFFPTEKWFLGSLRASRAIKNWQERTLRFLQIKWKQEKIFFNFVVRKDCWSGKEKSKITKNRSANWTWFIESAHSKSKLKQSAWSEFLGEMVFCYQNCSDLMWEKIVLVIEKNVWNLRLKAENLQNFWDH